MQTSGRTRANRLQQAEPWHIGMILLGIVPAITGCVLLGASMSGLRYAYLYRERTGEGMAFYVPGLLLVAGGALIVLATPVLLWASTRTLGRSTVVLRVAAAAIVGVLLACTIAASWVQGHSGCIGPCG